MTRLAEMTWPEVARAVAQGATTVILPLGATEQHGHHLPLGTDAIRAEALADRLAALLPDALVAPVLPVGCSDEHQGFAGLLSFEHETLARVIVDCARRMQGWGIERLVLLSAHGGNGRALALAAARLANEIPDLQVVTLGAAPTLSQALIAIASADGIPAAAVGLHAGEGESSELLALRPDLVRMEQAGPGFLGDMSNLVLRLEREGVRAVSPTGTLGDARYADRARGERYLAAQVANYAERCRQAIKRSGTADEAIRS